MKTLTMIDRFKDYWNNYIPLSKRQSITWLNKIEKELKELQIIKNKKVSMMLIETCDNFNEYNWNVALSQNTIMSYLTEEEFNLLKKIL